MQYAMPADGRSLASYSSAISSAVRKVRDLFHEDYSLAVWFARDFIAAMKNRHANFAERSFIKLLSPYVRAEDIAPIN